MIVGEANADGCIHLESTARSEDPEGWGSKGILRGERDPDVVESAFEFCVLWSSQCTMPVE